MSFNDSTPRIDPEQNKRKTKRGFNPEVILDSSGQDGGCSEGVELHARNQMLKLWQRCGDINDG